MYDRVVLSAAVVGLCALTALLMRNRPDLLVLTFATLWIVLPYTVVDGAYITYGIHPATFLILFGFATSIIASSSTIQAAWKNSVEEAWGVYAAIVAFLVLAGLSQIFSDAPFHGLKYALGVVIAPLAAFAVARCALYAEHSFGRRCLALILSLAAAESVLALAQSAAHQWLPFEAYFSQQYWYTPGTWIRYGGSLDHPLVLGLLLSVAMWSLWCVPWIFVRLGLAALYLAGTGVTQSRTAFLACVAGLLVMVAFAPVPAPAADRSASRMALQRLTSIVAVAIAVLGAWSILMGSDVVQRVTTDDGSGTDRRITYGIFFQHMNEFVTVGGGSETSKAFAIEHGSRLSFENPIMGFTADFGLLAALLYFGVQVAIAARPLVQRDNRDGSRFLALTAVVAIGVTQSFSSTNDASATILWLVLSLAISRGVGPPRRARKSSTPSSSVTSSPVLLSRLSR